MKYHCSWCDYIYDESLWDEDLEIIPYTTFDNLPNDFFCPFCDTYKDDFILFDEEVNYPIDINNLAPKEQEHFPNFTIKDDVLNFSLDENIHPNTQEHFISKISLYDEIWDEIDSKKFNFWDEINWNFYLDYLDNFELRVFCIKEGIFSSWILEK